MLGLEVIFSFRANVGVSVIFSVRIKVMFRGRAQD